LKLDRAVVYCQPLVVVGWHCWLPEVVVQQAD
jgi:hypothetical protein